MALKMAMGVKQESEMSAALNRAAAYQQIWSRLEYIRHEADNTGG